MGKKSVDIFKRDFDNFISGFKTTQYAWYNFPFREYKCDISALMFFIEKQGRSGFRNLITSYDGKNFIIWLWGNGLLFYAMELAHGYKPFDMYSNLLSLSYITDMKMCSHQKLLFDEESFLSMIAKNDSIVFSKLIANFIKGFDKKIMIEFLEKTSIHHSLIFQCCDEVKEFYTLKWC